MKKEDDRKKKREHLKQAVQTVISVVATTDVCRVSPLNEDDDDDDESRLVVRPTRVEK